MFEGSHTVLFLRYKYGTETIFKRAGLTDCELFGLTVASFNDCQ